MSENLNLIGKKLEHLARMRAYLDYSTRKMQGPLEKIRGKGLDALTPEEHETIAAFRTRLADFQEHLGKTMRSVAIEEEVNVDRFGSVLAFMEKMDILASSASCDAYRKAPGAVALRGRPRRAQHPPDCPGNRQRLQERV